MDNFYQVVLDNIPDGVYILDDIGNFIFVNTAYIKVTGVPRSKFLSLNVHDLKNDGQIDICISDSVYREKRQIVMFQDVHTVENIPTHSYRQLVVSTPIFDETGRVQNIVAVVRPLDNINDHYQEAMTSGIVSSVSLTNGVLKSSDIVAESDAMQQILNVSKSVANSDASVLITGESGVGKEIIAHYIHECSSKNAEPMIIINCAALPESLLEAELFGYEKGAFTGATITGKIGLIEAASGGTLFLDEINSLPLAIQGKLLRALETKTIRRIGSTKDKKVHFRLITATNDNLLELVENKRFRMDLYYRLNVIPIVLPPLRERKEDILPLAFHFLKHYCEKYGKNKIFTEKMMKSMMQYEWPGNVRELKNFVERSVVMSAGNYIEIEGIQVITTHREQYLVSDAQKIDEEAPFDQLIEEGISLDDYLANCEKNFIKYALERSKSSYEAAEVLKTSQSLIMRRKKKYCL